LITRWKQIKDILLGSISDGGQLDIYARQIMASQRLNYQVASSVGLDRGTLYATYEEEVARLKKWIRNRVSWFDKNINNINKGNFTVVYKVGKKTYEEIFYSVLRVYEDDLPNEPTKKGYKFKGWYVKKSKKEIPLLECTDLSGKITCYARWEKLDKVKGGAKIFFPETTLYFPAPGIGTQYSISYGSYPTDVPANKIKWKSSNPKKISVKNGDITLKSDGTPSATITATYKKTKIKCNVKFISTDKAVAPESFSAKKKKITMKKKTYKPIQVSFSPKNNIHSMSGNDLSYSSENPKIADVDSQGVIHAKKKGKTIIIVQYRDVARLVRVTVK
jgi:uncharacterized repeat protein (TIGR02543 family)